MKILLMSINTKYIHTNPAVYSLRQYAVRYAKHIVLKEFTINHEPDAILRGIYEEHPDVLCISCYLWNISLVREIVRDYKKIDASVEIFVGGPEVSYDATACLSENPDIRGVLVGEGEATFLELTEAYVKSREKTPALSDFMGNFVPVTQKTPRGILRSIRGLVFRDEDGKIVVNAPRPLLDFSSLPFPYEDLADLGDFRNKIIYYETSRGCPFSCCYCLSSVDQRVRFRDLDIVKRELTVFLNNRVALVKFVDRTFNCNEAHALAIWEYIRDHDNGVTSFHFEIAADLMTEKEYAVLKTMRRGLIQLEIGVQSTNPKTIEAIHRRMDLHKVRTAVARIKESDNIHQHLDLIAGLPYEDYVSFAKSFDEVYAMHPDQLQLGFLKVLKGSAMMDMVKEHAVRYKSQPPYEVLSTKYLSYDDVLRLKEIEDLVENYYNSGQFSMTIPFAERFFDGAFAFYEAFAAYYHAHGLFAVKHTRVSRYEIFYRFMGEVMAKQQDEKSKAETETETEVLSELLMFDYSLREKPKNRPTFAKPQEDYKEDWKRLGKEYLAKKHQQGTDTPGVLAVEHFFYDLAEAVRSGKIRKKEHFVLFDYSERDAVSGNCKAVCMPVRVSEFVSVDLETDGLCPEKNHILEIGAIRYHKGKEIGRFHAFIKREEAIPERIRELTGLTEEMLSGGKTEREAISDFLDFCADVPVLLAHNVKVDYSFLKAAAARCGREFEKDGLDTLAICRRLHSGLISRTLEAMCEHYGINTEQMHRALSDAKATAELYFCLTREFEEEPMSPEPLVYRVKKREPMTGRQKKYLIELLKYHKMEYTPEMETLSRSEASRLVDKIILTHGQMPLSEKKDR